MLSQHVSVIRVDIRPTRIIRSWRWCSDNAFFFAPVYDLYQFGSLQEVFLIPIT